MNFFLSSCRFDNLSRCFHVADVSTNPPREDPQHDKLAHIRNILDIVEQQMAKVYHPHREQSIDEAMVAFTGRLSFKQYLPMKPTKRGVKVWMRASPHNGFCHQFQVYTGRSRAGGREENLAARVVKDLSSSISHANHHLYMDNFFSSPALFEDLFRDGLLACGTVRVSRRGMPDFSRLKLKQQGQYVQQQKGSLLATAWHDKKTVNLLSTTQEDPQLTTTVRRKQKDGTTKDVPCPMVVREYTTHMNGVDRADQLRAAYSLGRKSVKWWKYLFWFCVDVTICNSFILMKESADHQITTSKGKRRERTQLEFRQALAKFLIGNVRRSRKRPRSSQLWSAAEQHWPTKLSKRRTCKQCSKSQQRAETFYGCEQCNVNLCITCFKPYHTSRPAEEE